MEIIFAEVKLCHRNVDELASDVGGLQPLSSFDDFFHQLLEPVLVDIFEIRSIRCPENWVGNWFPD